MRTNGMGRMGFICSIGVRLGRCGPKLVIGREKLQKSSRMFSYKSRFPDVSRCFGSFFRSFSPSHDSKISARRGTWHHHRNCGGLQLPGADIGALLLRGGLPSAVPGQTWSQAVLQRPAPAGAMAKQATPKDLPRKIYGKLVREL